MKIKIKYISHEVYFIKENQEEVLDYHAFPKHIYIQKFVFRGIYNFALRSVKICDQNINHTDFQRWQSPECNEKCRAVSLNILYQITLTPAGKKKTSYVLKQTCSYLRWSFCRKYLPAFSRLLSQKAPSYIASGLFKSV